MTMVAAATHKISIFRHTRLDNRPQQQDLSMRSPHPVGSRQTEDNHVNAAVIAIGDELTTGQRLDTNSQWLSQQLMAVGVPVSMHLTVPDDRDLCVQALAIAEPSGRGNRHRRSGTDGGRPHAGCLGEHDRLYFAARRGSTSADLPGLQSIRPRNAAAKSRASNDASRRHGDPKPTWDGTRH